MGQLILGNKRVEPAKARQALQPSRYPRLADEVLLSDLIDIICLQQLWGLFRPGVQGAFPAGAEEAQAFLRRIEAPRNNLAHANAVSVRSMEQVLCYSNDVIDSLNDYYRTLGMQTKYDVPRIITLRDYLGSARNCAEIHDATFNLWLDLRSNPDYFLRPGDEVSLEVEVDPAFETTSDLVQWTAAHVPSARGELFVHG
jgi:hypothetical protein